MSSLQKKGQKNTGYTQEVGAKSKNLKGGVEVAKRYC